MEPQKIVFLTGFFRAVKRKIDVNMAYLEDKSNREIFNITWNTTMIDGDYYCSSANGAVKRS